MSAAADSASQGCFSLAGGGGGSEDDSRSAGAVLGVSASDLQCPICVETIRDAFVTSCGHTFCHACLQTHLRNKRSCPSCSAYITAEHCYPNFLLSKILQKASTARPKPAATLADSMQRLLSGSGDSSLALSRLQVPDLDMVIEILKDRRQALTHQQHTTKLLLLLAFLNHAKQTKEQQLLELQAQLQVLDHDMHKLQQQRRQQRNHHHSNSQHTGTSPVPPAVPPGAAGGIPAAAAAAMAAAGAGGSPRNNSPRRTSSVIILNRQGGGAAAAAAAAAAVAAACPEGQVHVHRITADSVNTVTIQKSELAGGASTDLAQPLLRAWQQQGDPPSLPGCLHEQPCHHPQRQQQQQQQGQGQQQEGQGQGQGHHWHQRQGQGPSGVAVAPPSAALASQGPPPHGAEAPSGGILTLPPASHSAAPRGPTSSSPAVPASGHGAWAGGLGQTAPSCSIELLEEGEAEGASPGSHRAANGAGAAHGVGAARGCGSRQPGVACAEGGGTQRPRQGAQSWGGGAQAGATGAPGGYQGGCACVEPGSNSKPNGPAPGVCAGHCGCGCGGAVAVQRPAGVPLPAAASAASAGLPVAAAAPPAASAAGRAGQPGRSAAGQGVPQAAQGQALHGHQLPSEHQQNLHVNQILSWHQSPPGPQGAPGGHAGPPGHQEHPAGHQVHAAPQAAQRAAMPTSALQGTHVPLGLGCCAPTGSGLSPLGDCVGSGPGQGQPAGQGQLAVAARPTGVCGSGLLQASGAGVGSGHLAPPAEGHHGMMQIFDAAQAQAQAQAQAHAQGQGQGQGQGPLALQVQRGEGRGLAQAQAQGMAQLALTQNGHGQAHAWQMQAHAQAQAQAQAQMQAAKKRRMMSQFEELEGAYFQLRRQRVSTGAEVPAVPATALPIEAAADQGPTPASAGPLVALGPGGSARGFEVALCGNPDPDKGLDLFSEVLSTATHSNRLSVLAEMYRPSSTSQSGAGAGAGAGGGASASSSIISSIEFNLDESVFAAAGVSARISIYNYASILASASDRGGAATAANSSPDDDGDEDLDDQGPRRRRRVRGAGAGGAGALAGPATEICTRSKLTCLSYHKQVQQHLIAGDYNGVVTVWDTETQQSVMDLDGHDRRIWSVDFCSCPWGDASTFVSGSDDCTVKVWSTKHEATVAVLNVRANVCSVRYNPWDPHQVAVGSAGHLMLLYDLRHTHQPLATFTGHSKAVSYVRFLSCTEIVTASTDNTLRLWDSSPACTAAESLGPGSAINGGAGGAGSAAPMLQQLAGSCTRTFSGHQNERNFVGLAVDAGQFIACGSETNQVYLYYKAIATPSATFNLAQADPPAPAPGAGAAASASARGGFVSALCWRQQSHTLVAANSQGRMVLLGVDV